MGDAERLDRAGMDGLPAAGGGTGGVAAGARVPAAEVVRQVDADATEAARAAQDRLAAAEREARLLDPALQPLLAAARRAAAVPDLEPLPDSAAWFAAAASRSFVNHLVLAASPPDFVFASVRAVAVSVAEAKGRGCLASPFDPLWEPALDGFPRAALERFTAAAGIALGRPLAARGVPRLADRIARAAADAPDASRWTGMVCGAFRAHAASLALSMGRAMARECAAAHVRLGAAFAAEVDSLGAMGGRAWAFAAALRAVAAGGRPDAEPLFLSLKEACDERWMFRGSRNWPDGEIISKLEDDAKQNEADQVLAAQLVQTGRAEAALARLPDLRLECGALAARVAALSTADGLAMAAEGTLALATGAPLSAAALAEIREVARRLRSDCAMGVAAATETEREARRARADVEALPPALRGAGRAILALADGAPVRFDPEPWPKALRAAFGSAAVEVDVAAAGTSVKYRDGLATTDVRGRNPDAAAFALLRRLRPDVEVPVVVFVSGKPVVIAERRTGSRVPAPKPSASTAKIGEAAVQPEGC
jgi:hypothetical protein